MKSGAGTLFFPAPPFAVSFAAAWIAAAAKRKLLLLLLLLGKEWRCARCFTQ
jgi:hypothetical protein